MEALTFDIPRTALLALDCEAGLISVYAKPLEEFIKKASSALRAARDKGMQVIHVQVGFRPGLPEVSARNKLFAAIISSPQHQQFFQGASGAIHPALGPEPSDVVVTKHRVSAFTGTDLAMILRAKEIETVVLFGIATSGVVLSTLLDAADADYRVVVISDCCADLDAELHNALLNRLFPRGHHREWLHTIAAAVIGPRSLLLALSPCWRRRFLDSAFQLRVVPARRSRL